MKIHTAVHHVSHVTMIHIRHEAEVPGTMTTMVHQDQVPMTAIHQAPVQATAIRVRVIAAVATILDQVPAIRINQDQAYKHRKELL